MGGFKSCVGADLRDEGIDSLQAGRRFAQGARGQHQSVADAAIVLHDDFNVAGKVPVLQSVIADDDVGLGVRQQ